MSSVKEETTLRITDVTKATIEEFLAKIGWSLRNHGVEHYMFYNCHGKMTSLCLIFGERIQEESWNDKGLFGKIEDRFSFKNGSMAWYLKDIEMEFHSGHGYPSVCFFPKGIKNVWLDLYDTRKDIEK